MVRMILKPRTPDLVVRKPTTGLPLAADGEEVEFSSHWQRRLADGDVVEVTPTAAAKKPVADK